MFLEGKISFTKIYEINRESLERFSPQEPLTIDNILKYDKIVKNWVLDTYGGN